jgi:hypothetical protein
MTIATGPGSRCFQCNEEGSDLWVQEWDSGIHRRCLAAFLASVEGQIVLVHGHEIYVPEVQAEQG